MSKHILVLLVILTFFNLHIFAQKACKTQAVAPPGPTATISIFNDYFEPDCLNITADQTVLWGMYLLYLLY